MIVVLAERPARTLQGLSEPLGFAYLTLRPILYYPGLSRPSCRSDQNRLSATHPDVRGCLRHTCPAPPGSVNDNGLDLQRYAVAILHCGTDLVGQCQKLHTAAATVVHQYQCLLGVHADRSASIAFQAQ